jgi:hypothetical protein
MFSFSARYWRLGTVAVADDVGDELDGFRHLLVDAGAGKIHGGEVAGEVGELVSVLVVAFDGVVADLPVVCSLVFKGVEREAPGEASFRVMAGKGFAHGADAVESVPSALVAWVEFDVARDFPGRGADHDAESDEAIAQEWGGWVRVKEVTHQPSCGQGGGELGCG